MPIELMENKAREIILTHPTLHKLAPLMHKKTHNLKIHLFEVTGDLTHRSSFNAYLDTPVNFSEIMIIMGFTWNTVEYFTIVVPGNLKPELLPHYPIMELNLLESILLPTFYRFQVQELIHEQNQPLVTDFCDTTHLHRHGNNQTPRRSKRRLSCTI